MFIDTHCHLDDPKIRPDIDKVVEEFKNAGVLVAINIGCDLNTSKIVKEQAENIDGVYCSAGIHPQDVNAATDEDLYGIEALAKSEKCVAIGEIGLDYYWDKTFKEKQKEFFAKQIELAYSLKLPINVHVRDATADALNILKDNKTKLVYGGVMHCFSGSTETANELLKLGLYLSFGGTLTFKNARNIPIVAGIAPIDRILTETDSPYLSPEPLRGKVNTPKNIPIIAAKLAEIRGVKTEDIESAVYKNVKTLFPKIKE